MKEMKIHRFVVNYLLCITFSSCTCNEDYCYTSSDCSDTVVKHDRFLLYDVNPPEGFNLRRDVYMRFAILAHKLQNSKNKHLRDFKLVLPPWSRLVHWKYNTIPEQIPWGLYFDMSSLKAFAPVIEMHEFFTAVNRTYNVIDEVYILQHFKDMFETSNFEDRQKIEECQQKYQINYYFYSNITSHNVKCLSYHGPATKLSNLLNKSSAKVILFHHAEVALHKMFGNKQYWESRRSMRFNRELHQIANYFRKEYLNSTDKLDNTVLPDNWRDEKPHRNARGGPYLSVHLRRRDFITGRSHQAPSLDEVATQIINLLKQLELIKVFIATDAPDEEYQRIAQNISLNYEVYRYIPSQEVFAKYMDGGTAIVDQIICANGRHFVGTHESTFSFRIQEEREILGFASSSTFNSFCKGTDCPQPSLWKIVYD